MIDIDHQLSTKPSNDAGVRINLPRGKSFLVSFEDVDFVASLKWHIRNVNGYQYAQTSLPRIFWRRDLFLHRLIANAGPNTIVDHINGLTLDCRRSNLRLCTRRENNRNARKRAGSSQFKGVCWCKRTEKWLATITVDRKHKHLGYFEDERSAALAYNRGAMKYHGQFARLNTL